MDSIKALFTAVGSVTGGRNGHEREPGGRTSKHRPSTG